MHMVGNPRPVSLLLPRSSETHDQSHFSYLARSTDSGFLTMADAWVGRYGNAYKGQLLSRNVEVEAEKFSFWHLDVDSEYLILYLFF